MQPAKQLSEKQATLVGMGAVLLWASLTTLSNIVNQVPAFLLTGITFGIGFIAAIVTWRVKSVPILPRFKMSWPQWFIGILGIGGNIVFYYMGIKYAPVQQANLINYLWPLELVLLSSFLPGSRLKWFHILGVVFGVIGLIVLFSGRGEGQAFETRYLFGYFSAFVGGLAWAAYSVFRRANTTGSSDTIMVLVGAVSAVCLVIHFLFEETYIPASFIEWAALIGIGLGPTFIAFTLWEIGIKQGDIRLLGIGSFMIPLLSTGLLIISGFVPYSHTLALSCLLIVSGAGVASMDALRSKHKAG